MGQGYNRRKALTSCIVLFPPLIPRANPILCQEKASPYPGLLSLNPGVTGLTEIVGFKRF